MAEEDPDLRRVLLLELFERGHHPAAEGALKVGELDDGHLGGGGPARRARERNLEATEAVGLWFAKRWAEYLTFIATIVFIPYEIYELTKTISWLKVLTFVINVAIAVYLLYSKRLFGLRGGGKAEKAEHDADVGWSALEQATPRPGAYP